MNRHPKSKELLQDFLNSNGRIQIEKKIPAQARIELARFAGPQL